MYFNYFEFLLNMLHSFKLNYDLLALGFTKTHKHMSSQISNC